MVLVEYSDSSGEEDELPMPPPAKKRRVSSVHAASELPPLPTTFLDLYSSTARTSTQDDPSLHGGRKRVTPHVEGNWPTHVYLEWHPQPAESQALADLIAAQTQTRPASAKSKDEAVHSLLQNELGVSLPLHVSLSRPLVLRTEQRDAFLDQLRKGIQSSGVRAFSAKPAELRWHPNETGSRYFLVLSLQRPKDSELQKLLNASNAVAKRFQQPVLYEDDGIRHGEAVASASPKFHISIAWSLAPPSPGDAHPTTSTGRAIEASDASATNLTTEAHDFDIAFSDVKVRIGQDVTTIPLAVSRRKGLFT
ncbi:hypothetical protein LTR85_001966 [Meristemomyces frigidus]|nr:hypothetical protein LTR85_001966 [Meristemomyces frigidus]